MSGFVLGGGVTGLAAGMASGFTVLEAGAAPGGICASYYMRPREGTRLWRRPADEEAYRFELGGGHWVFGGDAETLALLRGLVPFASYTRRATAFFPARSLHVPFPVQHHAALLGAGVDIPAAAEAQAPTGTLRDWLQASFGTTLCREFFFPFHELYTGGLYHRIAPQDAYKSPQREKDRGYNAEFLYPVAGLDGLMRAMAARCRIEYGRPVTAIDMRRRLLHLADGEERAYTQLISTLPLNRMLELTGLATKARPDPYTSVLVLNIAATRGPACPQAHWTYLPHTRAGFHRIGFYSNVDPSFLPRSQRGAGKFVSAYVERAFAGGAMPSADERDAYARAVTAELREWGFIDQALLIDPTWIEIAYTWSWPGSAWRAEALAALAAQGITQVGRYAQWHFQGIAESVRDGLRAGAAIKQLGCKQLR